MSNIFELIDQGSNKDRFGAAGRKPRLVSSSLAFFVHFVLRVAEINLDGSGAAWVGCA